MQPGDKIGRYLLEKPLGEGAMSSVYVARHPQLEPRVAIKVLRREVSADKQYADRFLEDARAAASLNHPNIVGVKDFDTADGVPFIVMELVDGWSLDQWLKEKGKLEVRDAARVARDIALGLGAAHASKIVHRDVKPSNVLMDNKTGVAKLTDFGAAKRDRPEDQQLTAHGQTIGTPRYMAPEQVHGEPVDPRTDLWALGATLFEMLAGQPAFSATSLPRLYQAIVAEDPPRLAGLRPDVPPELASLVSRLLSKSRVARPDTAEEVAEALLPFTKPGVNATTTATTSTTASGAGPKPSPPPAAGGGGLKKPVLIGGGLAAAAVVAGLAFLLWPSPAPEPEVAVQTEQPPAPPPAPEPSVAEPVPPPEPTPAPVQEAVPEPPVEPVQEAEPAPVPEPVPAPVEQAAPAPEPVPAPVPVQEAVPAEPAPEPQQEQAALQPELPPVDEAAIGTALAGLSCVNVTPTVAEGGAITLAGTVADADLAAQVTRMVEGMPGVTSVSDALNVVAAPGCVAAEAVVQALANPAGPGPTVTMNRPDGIYREDDFVVLDVTMPPDLGGYLFVDLLSDSDVVYHLLPEKLTPNNRLEAGQTIKIGVEAEGRRPGVRHWQVAPPLVPGYLVLIASEMPIYEGLRELEEPLSGYLDSLLPVVGDSSRGKTSISVQRVEFRERS